MDKVKTTERGWAGHFICANRCRFRRNTLLEYKDKKIVVSSVGLMEAMDGKGFEAIGYPDRYFETMVWHADSSDTRYHDIDIDRPIYPDSPCSITEPDADDRANLMHDQVVKEISDKLIAGIL